ncbi:DUF1573 domain-containing protein [Candidatus Aminicenantes bacterium AC-334-K16]|jgi:phage shock protein E|nr:DUF1573 domain-containing protein [Candidatus Aminicenantes bacterium AC-334-K16]
MIGLLLLTSLSLAQLKADKEVFNFGTIREGINVPVKFKLTNTGSKEIHLKEIRTFAACVQREPLSKKKLTPGESIELNYVFASLGYGGASIEKEIQIFYEGSVKPLKIKIKGKILPLESYQAPLGEVLYNFFVLIDIRPPRDYQKEHIIGAINIPADQILAWAARWASRVTNDMVVYLYDEDGRLSDKIVQQLRTKGYRQYISLVGGLKEWKNQYGQKGVIGR